MLSLARMASAMVRAPALRMAPTSSVMPARSLRDFLGTEQEQQLLRDGKRIGTGRPWRASELRLKSYEDLQKLWYVLLKERNMLLSERERLGRETARKANVPQRIGKVKVSMARLQTVVGERTRAYRKQKELDTDELKDL